MLTVNGVRMSKSAGNGFLPHELFTGSHPLLEKGFDPMPVRFFMLQTHYRSTLDFSNEALMASEKGFARLMDAYNTLQSLEPGDGHATEELDALKKRCYAAMNDDFNTPVLIAELFDAARIINSANDKKLQLSGADINALKALYNDFIFDVLGLRAEQSDDKTGAALSRVMEIVLEIRNQAKKDRNFALSDQIRQRLSEAGIEVKDGKEGSAWKVGT
jgi:cysteinyl-tRNA synthetase